MISNKRLNLTENNTTNHSMTELGDSFLPEQQEMENDKNIQNQRQIPSDKFQPRGDQNGH